MIDSRDRPSVLLVMRIGAFDPAECTAAGFRRLARASHSGLAGLGATVATGCWVERHAVVGGVEPHPDRLSFARSMPEYRGVPVVWADAVRAGLSAAVVGWPHDTERLAGTHAERLAWTPRAAVSPAGDESPGPPLPGQVRPESRLPDFVRRRGEVGDDLTLELLEAHAGDGPDLLMGFMVDRSPEEATARLGRIVDRFTEARGGRPLVIEVRHPGPGESILLSPRFGPTPWIRTEGGEASPGRVRPRVDAITPMVRRILGIEPSPPGTDPHPGTGFEAGALDDAGLPQSRRISVYQLKGGEGALHREIGLSLLERGQVRSATTWLRSACEDQHGRVDPRVASLLLAISGPRDHGRLLREITPRMGSLADLAQACFGDESVIDPASLAPLGPFVGGHVAMLLRRAGRLEGGMPAARGGASEAGD